MRGRSKVSAVVVVAWLIGFASGVARPAAAVAAVGSTDLSGSTVQVSLDVSIGIPIVAAMINGAGPFRLLLDTGSSGSLILDQSLAEQLGIKGRGSATLGDANHPGSIHVSLSRVDSLSLGGAVFRNVDVAFWPDALPIHGARAPRGIIGIGLFSDVLLTLDGDMQQLELKRGELPRANGESVVNFDAPRGTPRIPVIVGGRRVLAELDCGSTGGLTLPEAYADSLELATPPADIGHGLSVNGEFPIRGAVLEGAVHFGGRNVEKPTLEFTHAPAANIGYRFLREFTFTIDQREKKIAFEP
jgi:predicted aspartyl protease